MAKGSVNTPAPAGGVLGGTNGGSTNYQATPMQQMTGQMGGGGGMQGSVAPSPVNMGGLGGIIGQLIQQYQSQQSQPNQGMQGSFGPNSGWMRPTLMNPPPQGSNGQQTGWNPNWGQNPGPPSQQGGGQQGGGQQGGGQGWNTPPINGRFGGNPNMQPIGQGDWQRPWAGMQVVPGGGAGSMWNRPWGGGFGGQQIQDQTTMMPNRGQMPWAGNYGMGSPRFGWQTQNANQNTQASTPPANQNNSNQG